VVFLLAIAACWLNLAGRRAEAQSAAVAAPNDCAILADSAKKQACFRDREAVLSDWVQQKKRPVAGDPGRAAPRKANPKAGGEKGAKPSPAAKPAVPQKGAPARPAPAAGGKPPARGDDAGAPSLAQLERWANEAIDWRDQLRGKQQANQPTDATAAAAFTAEVQEAEFRTVRIVGLILTMAGNCAPLEASADAKRPPADGGSCEAARVVTQRIVGRWLDIEASFASYKKLSESLRQLGLAEWQAGAVFALAAEARTDLTKLRDRLEELEKELPDERLKKILREEVLPAAENGPMALAQALRKLPDIERAQAIMVALRAALPGAMRRPKARILLKTAAAPVLPDVAAKTKKHFLYALKQILTATTGTSVCDASQPEASALKECDKTVQFDAELALKFVAQPDSLKIEADLALLNERKPAASASAGRRSAIQIPLDGTRDKCGNSSELLPAAVTAAWALMKELEWNYNVLGEVPHVGLEGRTLEQPLHDGVKIDEVRFPVEPAYGGPVSVTGTCDPELDRRFRARLTAGYGVVLQQSGTGGNPEVVVELHKSRTAIDELQRTGSDASGVLEGAQRDLNDGLWCLAWVKAKGNTPLYAVLARANEQKLLSAAGHDLGSYVGGVLFQYRTRANIDRKSHITTTPPPPPKVSPLLTAALAPGVPLLTDSKPGNDWLGYTWLIADSVALVGSIGFAYASINERNAAAEGPERDFDRANDLLAVSSGLAVAWVASRVVSIVVVATGAGSASTPQQGNQRDTALVRW